VLDVPVDEEGAAEIARRARGTPRVSLRLLRRVRDYAQVRAERRHHREVALEALQLLEIDALGLDNLDRRVLEAIIGKFGGGPVGLETIAASISEEADTIMDVVEPYLLQLGFLERTARGRVATPHAYAHLGVPLPGQAARKGSDQPACLKNDMLYYARILIIIGIDLVLAGGVILLAVRYFPWLGNLPGDIRYERENFKFYFPLATMLLLSIVASVVLNIVMRIFRR
jgi:hypothetical protein